MQKYECIRDLIRIESGILSKKLSQKLSKLDWNYYRNLIGEAQYLKVDSNDLIKTNPDILSNDQWKAYKT